jgi:cold shock CspA family protein
MKRNTLVTIVLSALAGLAGMISVASAQEPTDLTGSWFDPENSGYGFVIDDAPDAFVLYWYDYETGFGSIRRDAQAWFVGSAESRDGLIELYRPSGSWNASEYDRGDPVGSVVVGELADGTLVLDYEFFDFDVCQPVMVSPAYSGCSGTIEVERLTRR